VTPTPEIPRCYMVPTPEFTRWLLIIIFWLMVGYDVVAINWVGHRASFSAVLHDMGSRYPEIPAVLAILWYHAFCWRP